MANKNAYPAKTTGIEQYHLCFQFTAPGAGTSVTITTLDGGFDIATIAHVGGTNTMQVTMSDLWNKVLFANATIRDTTGRYATIGNFANEASATAVVTFDISIWQVGGNVGVAAADPTDVVMVDMWLRNTAKGTGIA